MGQMAAMIQIHSQNLISGRQHRKKRCQIRLGARVRLHVGVVASIQLLRTLSCQILYDINTLATSIIPSARIPFCILVGQRASHGCHNCLAYPVFRCNQFDMRILSFHLFLDCICNLAVYLFNLVKIIHSSTS